MLSLAKGSCFNGSLKRDLPAMGAPGGKNRAFAKRSTPSQTISAQIFRVAGKVLAGIFSGLILYGAAFAEDVAKGKVPEFVPIVVDQSQYAAVMNYLGGLKFNDAAPVVRWLNELEDRAKGQWEADHKPKEAVAP